MPLAPAAQRSAAYLLNLRVGVFFLNHVTYTSEALHSRVVAAAWRVKGRKVQQNLGNSVCLDGLEHYVRDLLSDIGALQEARSKIWVKLWEEQYVDMRYFLLNYCTDDRLQVGLQDFHASNAVCNDGGWNDCYEHDSGLNTFIEKDRWKKDSSWRDYIRNRSSRVEPEYAHCNNGCEWIWIKGLKVVVKPEFAEPWMNPHKSLEYLDDVDDHGTVLVKWKADLGIPKELEIYPYVEVDKSLEASDVLRARLGLFGKVVILAQIAIAVWGFSTTIA